MQYSFGASRPVITRREQVSLFLVQVPYQHKQGHRGRWPGSPGKLLGDQIGALHLERQPVPTQTVEQAAAFIDGLDLGFGSPLTESRWRNSGRAVTMVLCLLAARLA
nr:hypothetical protein [Nonomuraea turkmeniaca]